jgi:TPR repeat protein
MARDFDSAMRLAAQGNVDAQFIVGKMYMTGQGVEADSEQAMKWFRAAASQGNVDAQFFLGATYLMPQKDVAEGMKWLRLAAAREMQDAQFLLGIWYLKGQNFTHDPVRADMWLRLAAAQGGEFYQSQLVEAEKQLTPDQIEKAKALAAAWKPQVD